MTPPEEGLSADLRGQLMRELVVGLAGLGLSLAPGVQGKLLSYLALLLKWNKAHNLTSVEDPRRALVVHLLDSLSILGQLRGERLLDVGSGAGLPGIPLALARPGTKVVLIDSNGKKVRFLFHAKALLQLHNVMVRKTRAEDYVASRPFSTVVARALGSLERVIRACGHLVSSNGCLLVMKGRLLGSELAGLDSSSWQVEAQALKVPGLRHRHVVVLCPRKASG